MVPITVLAFYCAIHTIGLDHNDVMDTANLTHYDIIGIVVVGFGVFAHNFFKQKTQKASIEEDF